MKTDKTRAKKQIAFFWANRYNNDGRIAAANCREAEKAPAPRERRFAGERI
ncbi:MAG: hypothetical protein IJL26_03975 [Clostridia bacterium]|nr:hypothetical protein [Clostridia bacterium]